MGQTGSALTLALDLFVAAVEKQAMFNGVPINWGDPRDPDDVTRPDGSREAMWLGDADSDLENMGQAAGLVEYEENWEVPVTIQVIRDTADTKLSDVWKRAEELWDAVLAATQPDPDLSDTSNYSLFQVLLSGPSVEHGTAGQGYGVRYNFELLIRARISAV